MEMEKIEINHNQYVWVDKDAEIKTGDFFLTDDNRIEINAPDWRAREWHRKIIAASSELNLNGVPINL